MTTKHSLILGIIVFILTMDFGFIVNLTVIIALWYLYLRLLQEERDQKFIELSKMSYIIKNKEGQILDYMFAHPSMAKSFISFYNLSGNLQQENLELLEECVKQNNFQAVKELLEQISHNQVLVDINYNEIDSPKQLIPIIPYHLTQMNELYIKEISKYSVVYSKQDNSSSFKVTREDIMNGRLTGRVDVPADIQLFYLALGSTGFGVHYDKIEE